VPYQEHRIVTVSNRLPIVVEKQDGDYTVKGGTGGLVTALAPVLSNRGGLWIGWSGIAEEEEQDLGPMLEEATANAGYTLIQVPLTRPDIELFYHGFSNEIIWPLFHDLQSLCRFDPRYWKSFLEVNRKFASVIAGSAGAGDYIWVHDYHLMNVAKELRELGITCPTGFFLHIPFPTLDIFLKLPWRFEVLRALLAFDHLGFQTLRDRRNFVQCVRHLLKDVPVSSSGQFHICRVGDRDVRLGSFPISIDYSEFAGLASNQDVSDGAWYIHEALPGKHIIFGIDRLDYTKGIPLRLEAFREALRRYPELQQNVTLIQVVVPSRTHIRNYMEMKTDIERLVSEINGEFTISGWVPIHYIYRSLTRSELLSYYRTAEIALITPIKDGMNLVAKEYCASNLEENGVLILSEFAGAVSQLQDYALLVNPYDIEGVADAIIRAYNMPNEERNYRMRRMRAKIRRQDVYWWVHSFLRAAFSIDLVDFPVSEEYVPTQEPEEESEDTHDMA